MEQCVYQSQEDALLPSLSMDYQQTEDNVYTHAEEHGQSKTIQETNWNSKIIE